MKKQTLWEYMQLRRKEVEQFCIENDIVFNEIWSSPKSYNDDVIYFQDKYADVPKWVSTPPVLIVTRHGDDLTFEICDHISKEYRL